MKQAGRRGVDWAWELWHKGDGWERASYVRAFKDKGQAKAYMHRLKRSHPYASYFLKHVKTESRHVWGAPRQSKKLAKWRRRQGWS